MADEELEKVHDFMIGYYFCPITSDVAPLYRLKATGQWISTITPESAAEKAGLMVKDVLMAFDDEPAGNAHAAQRAKLRLLNGEEITIHYSRNDKEYTTVVSLDSDSIPGKEASTD